MQNYNICFSLDSKYTEQFCVSAVSILKNSNINDNINFYILDGGLTEKDKTYIELLKNIKDFNIEYLQIDEKDFKDCPLLKEKGDKHKDYHVTLPTYFRFKLPELLPKLEKILYLDCDVIVRTSLKELFAVSFKDKAVAMVEDVESKREAARLGLKKYCNAGVMLINLDYWRKNDISRLLFDYVKTNKKKILWQDQDVINAVLDEKIKYINNKWNYQYFLYDEVDSKKLSECCILHLAGRFKPWLMPFEHFLYDYYYSYLLLTPFSEKIIEYKQKSSGKFLKNDVGGSQTNILLQVNNEDVQKLYNEITKNYDYVNKISLETASKLESINKEVVKTIDSINAETDVKVSKVYEEITKNYEYTNELRAASKAENEVLQADIEVKLAQNIEKTNVQIDEKLKGTYQAVTADTDEKISKVYEEITKNYEYTNELVDGVKLEKESLQADVDAKVAQSAEEVTVVTDEKITKVYEEITKNYEYTNELVDGVKVEKESLQADVDAKVAQVAEEVTVATDEKITKVYEEITKNYEYTNELRAASKAENEVLQADVDAKVAQSAEEVTVATDEKITKVYEEITKNYEYTNELRTASKAENEVLRADIEAKLAQNIEETNAQIDEKLKGTYQSVTADTDEKIGKVYEEITKNYEYTNELRDSAKIELDEKVLELKKSFEVDNDAIRTEISDKENIINEKLVILERNIIDETDENFELIKKEITTLYEKVALNDEILRKDFNELKEIFLNKLENKVEYLISQLDDKVSSIYDDMGVLCSDIETLIKQKALEIIAQTDEKIGKVYDEISKNYDYTNKLAQENKDLAYSVKSELEQQLKNAQENIYSYVDHSSEIVASVADEKIKNVENKIAKNMSDFEIAQNRKNDLKISEVYAYANNELTKVFKQVHQNSVNFENKLELKSYETYKNIEEDRREIASIKQSLESKTDFSDFNKLEEEFAEKLQMLDSQHQEQISKLVSDFENKLNEQRIKYETKLMNMENHVAVLEQKYIDSKKGFFTKVIEKCKKR